MRVAACGSGRLELYVLFFVRPPFPPLTTPPHPAHTCPPFLDGYAKFYAITAQCVTPAPGSLQVLPLAGSDAASYSAFVHPQCATGSVLASGTGSFSCPAGFYIASIIGVGGYNPFAGSCGSYLPTPCPGGAGIGNTYNFTASLTGCVGAASCTFPASTAAWGDWCFGFTKYWMVTAACALLPTSVSYITTGNALATVRPSFTNPVCNTGFFSNGVGTIGCPTGTYITSIVAIAGMGVTGSCGTYVATPCTVGGGTLNMSALASAHCRGTSSCSFPASVSALGDFCLGYAKRWAVQATCSPLQQPIYAPSPTLPIKTCTTGAFQSGVVGTLSCPPGTIISSVSALAGGAAPVGGAGCFYTISGCTAGAGGGLYFDFSAATSTLCEGRAFCQFPAGTGSYAGYPTFATSLFSDFCFGFVKFWYAVATCVPVPAGVALPPAQYTPPSSPTSTTVCATGAFQSGISSTITCPAGTVIGNITALSGGANGVQGSCGNYSVTGCTAGVGVGTIFVFSAPATAQCAGLNSCTFPTGFGGSSPYADYCSGYAKFFYVQATCVPTYAVPVSAAFSLACTSGAYLATTTGSLGCPLGSVITSVVAIAGYGVVPQGSCGTFLTKPCTIGVGTNGTLDFSNSTTALCAGLQNCTFPASVSAYSDFCCTYTALSPRPCPIQP